MKNGLTLSLLAAAVAGAFLTACGGGGGDDNAAPAPPAAPPAAAAVTGVFLDNTVEGLDYAAGASAKAASNAAGEFSCKTGDSVAFSVGGLALGSAACATRVTPLTLAGGSDTRDVKVVNRLLALQLLDEDSDPSNGIKISAEVKAALATRTLDFSANAAAFDTALAATLALLPAQYKNRTVDAGRRALVSEHFEDTLASKLGTPVNESMTQTNALGGVTATVTRYQIQASSSFYIPYEGANSAIKGEFPLGFLPSYGSGLAFKGSTASGDLEFYGITDRGPNGDGPNVPALGGGGVSGSKIFPAPSFIPTIGVITVSKTGGAVLTSKLPIKASASVNSSGLPLPVGAVGNSAEVPVLDAMQYNAAGKATFDINGLDTESIVFDKTRKALWVSDEYGPFILRIDPATGVIANKYQPGQGLPAIFAKRRANRGMEGLTLDTTTDKLHGYLQSPLTDGKAAYSVTGKSEDIEKFAGFNRWIEFDPSTGLTTRMYAYPLNAVDWADGRTGNAKLGDVVALGNGKFIVIEQGAGASGQVVNKLMLVEVGNATDIAAAAYNPATSDLEKSSMGALAVNGADWSSVVPLKKTLLFDLNAAGWLAEKAEGLTLVDEFTLAMSNDNDFGMKTIVYDANGAPIDGADVTKCNVDTAGVLVTSSTLGCNAANTIRVGRGTDMERPSRLWLIKFGKALSSFSVPAQ